MIGAKTTYILGAGASCEALPLISDMNLRIEIFLEFLKKLSNTNFKSFSNSVKEVLVPANKSRLKNVLTSYYKVFSQMKKHYTPDTYAKKLSLKEDEGNLLILKNLINDYIIFEQSFMENQELTIFEEVFDRSPLVRMAELTSNGDGFKRNLKSAIIKNVDNRYDVFLATLLHKAEGDLVLSPNVNILSWNYDNQIEIAYKEYLLSDKKVNEVLKINSQDFNVGHSHILKLNGYAKLESEVNDMKYDYTLKNLLFNIIYRSGEKPSIKFAWENDNMTEFTSLIHHITTSSKNLVVIGYSFPNFNRSFDLNHFTFKEYINLSKIFIQVPYANEFEAIKNRMINNLYLQENSKRKYIHISNCNQFYIP